MAKVKSPQEVGLPEKFDKWRSGQEEALEIMTTDPRRFIATCAPTGFGKSPVYVAAALLSNEPTCIVTASRGLQDQLMKDFASIGMVDIRGRNNYNCQCKPDDDSYTCEDGYVARCPYKGTIACPSSQAEMRAATSSLVVTNYAKWTAAKKFGQGMSHFKRVIFDEAHNAPAALAAAMQVVLNHREVEDGLQVPFLAGSDAASMEQWKQWAIQARAVADAALQFSLARITGVADPKPTWIKHYTHMRNLCRRLSILATARADDWVVDETEGGYQFDPIRPGRYAESTLFLHVPKVIMVSATLRPKTLFMCNVAKDQFTFKEFSSDFDPKRCPIYYVPTMRVDRRATDLGLLWAMLDRIAAKRRDRKGIVHTVSYARQEEIAQRSRFFESMIVNPKGSPASETVELFKKSIPGTILVSPSVGEGYDFPMDECRWQMMAKIPFEPPSKIVKAREAADPEYRAYQAIQSLVQSFGRGMRSKEDLCVAPETRILTHSLRWVRADSLKMGDSLLAFSENPEKLDKAGSNQPRVWRRSEVQAIRKTVASRLRLVFEGGELVCTPEHPLLIKGVGRVAGWKQAAELEVGDHLVKLIEPWEDRNDYIHGWLAGFTDGEGCLQVGSDPKRANLQGLYLAQNDGAVLIEVECCLIRLGFKYSWQNRTQDCKVLKICGGVPELLRFLGEVRPLRLLEKFNPLHVNWKLQAASSPRVLAIRYLEDGEIVRLKTSTHTYVSEGLASHNCENFIGDQHIEWFLPRYGHLAPRSFHGFFRRVEVLPQPPSLS